MAQGAIAFFLDGIVKSRVSPYKYGIKASVPYDPYDPQHAERSSQALYMADGVKRLPNTFSTILDEVCYTGPPALTSPLPYHREYMSLKHRSFGRALSKSRDRDGASIESMPLSKLTRGALKTRVGLILSPVTL